MTGSTPVTSTMIEQSTTGQSTSLMSKKSDKTTSRGTRENKVDKALRYLKEARLTVVMVEGDVVHAECRGDSGSIYQLGFHDNHWSCDCPARVDCSHLIALQRVTVRPK